MFRKTKIVCTLGPSTDKEGVLKRLIEEGMNVARFNFSHGDHEEQLGRLQMLQKLRKELKRPVAALLDTKGPEIRLRDFTDGKVELKDGQTFTLTTDEIMGDAKRVSITYKNLPEDVKPGDRILIDDGLIGMEVKEIKVTSGAKADKDGNKPKDIICQVLNGGVISNRKGVNVPNVELSMPYISEKDYGDIVFAVEHDYDFIAASFVRTADDVLAIRKILAEKGGEDINIIAKIENMHTRVEDPQELDTRFAKFAPSGDDTDGPEPVQYSGADDIIDLFHKLCDVKNKAQEIAKKAAQKENEKEPAASEEKNVDLVRTFHFSTLDDVISSAKALNQYFTGSNSLYKNRADANYQLVLHQSGCKPEEFNKVCNILSEYGRQESFSLAAEAFLLEHGNAMVKENALQELASL